MKTGSSTAHIRSIRGRIFISRFQLRDLVSRAISSRDTSCYRHNHWGGTTLLMRAGELSTAFGSFMLRYDDAANPLINLPLQYGYYYIAVSADSVAGVQADVTSGKWDARVQLANSSPANPRSPFQKDQYANWTGGGGYTILQGFRVGASIYHGPYLDRDYPFFFPGEANPNKLPATGVGVDVQYARGHWNLQGEWQKFQMDYHVIPTFRQRAGYGEVKRVLNPRWYVAARVGYLTAENFGSSEYIEAAAGYRPGANQLIKIDYEFNHGLDGNYNTEAIQYVVTLHPISLAFGN